METGLADTGYDCSGLIVAAMAEALEIRINDWPRDLRHVFQMARLEEDIHPQPGDIVIFYMEPPEGRKQRTHAGVFVADNYYIHADGYTGSVREGEVTGPFLRVSVVPWAKMKDEIYRSVLVR